MVRYCGGDEEPLLFQTFLGGRCDTHLARDVLGVREVVEECAPFPRGFSTGSTQTSVIARIADEGSCGFTTRHADDLKM